VCEETNFLEHTQRKRSAFVRKKSRGVLYLLNDVFERQSERRRRRRRRQRKRETRTRASGAVIMVFFSSRKKEKNKQKKSESAAASPPPREVEEITEEEEETETKNETNREEDEDERNRSEVLLSSLFTCPITQEVFELPITLRCGHTFSKQSLLRWMTKKQCCPTCRKPQYIFDGDELAVNKVVENAVEQLVMMRDRAKSDDTNIGERRGKASSSEDEKNGAGEGGEGQMSSSSSSSSEKRKRLPLFVLDAVVPGTELMLNVFEPKLRLMVQTVLTQHFNPSFVMCARTVASVTSSDNNRGAGMNNNNNSNNRITTIAKYGIIARIIAANETVDGRFLIRIRADSEKVVVIEKSRSRNSNNDNDEGRNDNDPEGRRASGDDGTLTEEVEEQDEEAFPICEYTERKDAPWSPLTERLAGSADEAKASLLLAVDEAEATFYAWATLAEKSGFFGAHACFAHDDCVSGCEGRKRLEKDQQRRRRKSKRQQKTLDESTEDERERNLSLSDVVFRWKASLEEDDTAEGEVERLNEINNERDYDLTFDSGNESSFRRQQLVTRFKHRGGGGINNMQRPSFEDVRTRPEQFASVLLWWLVRCVNPIPSAGAALEIRPSMLSTRDAKTRFALFSKLLSVSTIRVLGYAPMEWMNWECVKEKRMMKKIGEVLSKERKTLSAATIRKEEIGKDDANRRKVRILIETCLSIIYEYSKEEATEGEDDGDEQKQNVGDEKETGIPTVSGIRIVFTDEELESFGTHKLALTLRDALQKVAHKRKTDRKAQRKRVQNLRALAKALKHNLDENEFFQMFDPLCRELTTTNNNYIFLTSNNQNTRRFNTIKRIRMVAKLRRFFYQAQSFIRGVSFGAKVAYEKFFWIAGLILFSFVIFALIVQTLKFMHRFGPSQEEVKRELQRVQEFAREFANVIFYAERNKSLLGDSSE